MQKRTKSGAGCRKKGRAETVKTLKEIGQALKDFLKESFAEVHHPLNPAPEVMEKLKEKGYCFEFGVQALTKGYLCKNFTVVTPNGKRIGTAHIPPDRMAAAVYNKDYKNAVMEVKRQKPPSAP